MSQNNVQHDQIHDPRVTWEGCSVLLDINDGDRLVFARLSAGSTLKIGNKNCSLRPLVGCPFGSLFQIENGNQGPYLSRIVPSSQGNNNQVKEDSQARDESRDNRSLVDNNTAQSLTGEDIDEMRRQGVTGDEIVEALIANSATFEKKTLFSQEKYKLKKQKKYAPRVLLRRPVSRSICETYFKKYPARIGFLRIDTLSLLLSMANITSNSDVLVMDMLGGILTGAVAERLGGTGYVCNTYMGNTPYSMDIVRIFNFSNEICKRILCCPLSVLYQVQNGNVKQNGQQGDICNMETQPNVGTPSISSDWISCVGPPTVLEDHFVQEQISSHCSPPESVSMEKITVSSENRTPNIVPEAIVSLVNKTNKSTKAGDKASQEEIKMWKENGFSSLIIAAPELDAWTIVKEALPLLSYSAPFAIYHQYLQPLATCMHNLQLEKMAIGLQISEPWLREYQVLPSRTHPCMQMSAFGGYILSGTRICGSEIQLHEDRVA